jgi:hypothetical protein
LLINKERLKWKFKHFTFRGEDVMVFEYEGWTLYTRDVNLKGGRTQTIYFFSKRTPKSGTPCDKPDNMTVGVNKRTGLPYLKKK